MPRLKVFISGPYTQGDIADNVRKAMDVAVTLIDMGCAPFCPHLNHFLHMQHPRPYETWMAWDMEWLIQCDCVLRLPGESPGGDREVARAKELKKPVFTDLPSVWAFRKSV